MYRCGGSSYAHAWRGSGLLAQAWRLQRGERRSPGSSRPLPSEDLHMNVRSQIKAHIAAQTEPARSDLQKLHDLILGIMPGCKLWFIDGKDENGRTVSNPNVGYGSQTMTYADGKTREFYQIGTSANTTGISIYIMGLKDKSSLPKKYGKKIGQATVTGYCIKFRTLAKIDVDVLVDAMRYGIEQTSV